MTAMDFLTAKSRYFKVNGTFIGGQCALHAAATVGSTGCLRALLGAGADVNAPTDRKHTALMVGQHRDDTVAILPHRARVQAADMQEAGTLPDCYATVT